MKILLPPEEAARVPDLFAEASALPPERQPGYLAQACADAPLLRAEVESLLDFRSKLPEFLARPAIGLGLEQLGLDAAGNLPPGTMLGEHRVISLLGVGGMGEVYLAKDTVHDRQVALKLIGQGRAEDVRGRHFRHERKVLAALNHPHIARLYGSGVTPDGRAYLVMEYVEGERLDRFCQEKALGVHERLALFRKVCAAVAYAHQNLVVHRDLKPANIRVTPEGEPKLLDFGIAKLLDPEEATAAHADPTATLQGAMTPEYASPEQLKGEAITTASDVYSLGVVLFELLTGRRPFAHLKGRRPDELARAVCEEEAPRPSIVASQALPTAADQALTAPTHPAAWRRQLTGDLDNIVVKTLRKEPTRRYPGVLALAEDLRRHDEGLPVRARADTLGYRAGKFIRRNKVWAAAAALVALALVTGLVTAVWEARLAGQERDRAQTALAQTKIAQKEAEHVNAFLQSLIASANVAKLGKDARLAEVIDAAAAHLDRDLANEPEVLIEAHLTLRRTYSRLGLYAPAEQQARAALDLARRLHGANGRTTAIAEAALAQTLTDRYQWNEGEPLLRHALRVLRGQTVPDEAALAETLQSLSFALSCQGHPDQAEPLATEALVHARAAWGEHSADYAVILDALGNAKFSRWDYAAAAEVYRDVVALQDRIDPGGGHSTVPLMNLCICLFNEGKLAEARTAVERLEKDTRRLFGEKSVYLAIATYGRGVIHATEGDYQTAIPLLREALPVLAAAYAPGQTSVVQCRAELGLCLTRAGQATEGETFLRAALADGGSVERHDFAFTIGNLETALGECLLTQRRYAEAEPLLLTGLADLGKRLGPQNRFASQTRQRLRDLYLAWDKPAEAARFVPIAAAPASPAP